MCRQHQTPGVEKSKRSTIWAEAGIDMNIHIIKHFQANGGAKTVEAYDEESPYVTLLKPDSYPNPWYRAGAKETTLDQEEISVADSESEIHIGSKCNWEIEHFEHNQVLHGSCGSQSRSLSLTRLRPEGNL